MTGQGQELYTQAKQRIPGGTQLLSKRPEMFLPEQWPSYFSRAKGVEVWDLDEQRYIDMSYNGIGACLLGAADPDVDQAVSEAIAQGTMSTLNCPEEVELAELLCSLHPWASLVRYARCGGEAMAMAVRIARAHTGKEVVAFCGYHGWHDWYLAANLGSDAALDGHLLPGLAPRGVPRGLQGTAVPFQYNQIEELQRIVTENGSTLAAIVMEPIRDREPTDNFLEQVRATADELSIPLIFDEVSAGFRLCTGGAHLTLGVDPDIAVFAKGMSNGYPMAAVLGRDEVMSAAQDTFISSTYWTDRIGPVAALATIKKHQAQRVHEHLITIGTEVQDGWRQAATEAQLPIHVGGIAPLAHFTIEHDDAAAARTLFTQLMLARGYLATGGFYATYAHTAEHVQAYLVACAEAFATVAQSLQADTVRTQLEGGVAHTGFHRLT